MNDKFLQDLEKLYIQMGKPAGTRLFVRKEIYDSVDAFGLYIELDGDTIPVEPISHTIPEISMGDNRYKSEVFLAPVADFEFIRIWHIFRILEYMSSSKAEFWYSKNE